MFCPLLRPLSVSALLALAVALSPGCAKRRSTLDPSVPYGATTRVETNIIGAASVPAQAQAQASANAGAAPENTGASNVSLTPVGSPVGRISSVNQQVMIAVVAFPVGQVPAAGARYSVFRAGQKVGELKMSEETADTLRVADITSGALQIGDEVRVP